MKSVNITSKNFGSKLSGVVRSAKTMRDTLQNLILFGLEHYAEHNDTIYLTKCMRACVGANSLPTGKMKVYIQDHANVKWTEVVNSKGEKELVWKMSGKKAIVSEPDTTWYEYSIVGDAAPDLDVDTRIINLFKAINKASKEHKLKNPQHAMEVRAGLVELAGKVGIALPAQA